MTSDADPIRSRPRLFSLDVLRFGAVVAVVVQHATGLWMETGGRTTSVGFANRLTNLAVPLLFMTSGYLSARFPATTARARWRRIRRALVPYVGWSAVYFALFALLATRAGRPIPIPSVAGLFSGEGVYLVLWYLPMLIYCTAIGWTLRTRRGRLVGLVVAAACWIATPAISGSASTLAGAAEWLGVLSLLVVSMTFFLVGAVLWTPDESTLGRRAWAFIGPSVVVIWIGEALLNASSADPQGLPLLLHWLAIVVVSLTLLAGASRSNLPRTALGAAVASTALGAYVMHNIIIVALSKTVPPASLPWPVWTIGAAAVACFAAVSISLIMCRSPTLRPFVS